MKRNLVIAALLSAAMPLGALAQTTGSDDPNMTGSTQRMFIINSTSPGALTFSGSGTAQFNNSVGTANQFNVGSSTNLGVNASVSSTREFDAQSVANLSLAGTSTIMQSQGTSANAANQVAVMEQSHQQATEIANGSTYGSSWSSEWASQGSWGGEWGQTDTDSGRVVNGHTYTSSGEWEAASKAAWKSGWESTYDTAYSNASRAATTVTSNANETGVISGSFVTRENSNSQLSQSSSISDVVAAATTHADTTTEAKYGSTYDSSWSTATDAPTWYAGSNWSSETDRETLYNSSKSTFRDEQFQRGAQAAAASVASVSDSQVKVTGLGAIITINASEASNFLVDLTKNSAITQIDSTATANGNASASVGTSSYATQNNQRTASAFMQAFAGRSDADTTTTTDTTTTAE